MPDVELCSCEKIARSEFGLVEDHECLARIVLTENHISKRTGEVKPNVFPPSHIAQSGLSLMRVDKMDEATLEAQAQLVAASAANGNKVAGVLLAKALTIRALVDRQGRRSMCVFDDPTENNPAHATSCRSADHGDDDIKEMRGTLMEMFLPLTQASDVYR